MNQRKAYLFALTAVLCWSTVASAFKLALQYLDVYQLLLYASFTTIVVLFTILAAQKKLGLIRRFSTMDYLKAAILGLMNPFLYYIVLFNAYSLLPAQLALPLNYTWPIMLVLLSIPLLKQRIKPLTVMAVIISFAGVVIISTRGNLSTFEFVNPGGVALALGSSVIWGLYWIFNMKEGGHTLARLLIIFCFGFVYILIATLIFSNPLAIDVRGLAGAVYVGLFEMGVTFVFWLKALEYSSNTAKVSVLIYLSPFLSLIWIHFLVGEKIYPSTIIGLGVIIGGILVQNYPALLGKKKR